MTVIRGSILCLCIIISSAATTCKNSSCSRAPNAHYDTCCQRCANNQNGHTNACETRQKSHHAPGGTTLCKNTSCSRAPNAPHYDTCCQRCANNQNGHTNACDTRQKNHHTTGGTTLCTFCSRAPNAHYDTCCQRCANNGHTNSCDARQKNHHATGGTKPDSLRYAWESHGYVCVTGPTVCNLIVRRKTYSSHQGPWFNSCNFPPNSTSQERVAKFKRDLLSNAGHQQIADIDKRAWQRSRNWELLQSPILSQDLAKAQVTVGDFDKMVLRHKALGFSRRMQFNQFCGELSDTIRKAFVSQGFTNSNQFSLVFSGTATTFYTENP